MVKLLLRAKETVHAQKGFEITNGVRYVADSEEIKGLLRAAQNDELAFDRSCLSLETLKKVR